MKEEGGMACSYAALFLIPYRAKPDGARPPEGHALWDARKGIPYRAKPDGARPPEGHTSNQEFL